MAQAQAFDRWGKTAASLQAWKMLSEQHPFSEEGRKAAEACAAEWGGGEATLSGDRLRG